MNLTTPYTKILYVSKSRNFTEFKSIAKDEVRFLKKIKTKIIKVLNKNKESLNVL